MSQTKRTADNSDCWQLGSRVFSSRLLLGTGKYSSSAQTGACVLASGAEIVTVAVRRAPLDSDAGRGLLAALGGVTVLPNTAGCYTAADAVYTCQLARELLEGAGLVKLEVLGGGNQLYPNMKETFIASETLVKEGFEVMVYMNDDPVAARELSAIGCVAIMPLASPIGSGLGILSDHFLKVIIAEASVPVIVDAGVGTASDAACAMELGCTAVLLNTAVAQATDPLKMAEAMRYGVYAGRMAYCAGRMQKTGYGAASSPPVL